MKVRVFSPTILVALFLCSDGTQASFKFDVCKAALNKDDCKVYEKAYDTLGDLQNATAMIEELQREKDKLLEQNRELEAKLADVTSKREILVQKTFFLSAVTNKLVEQHNLLKAENGLLKKEAIRYQKFLQMFPDTYDASTHKSRQNR